ncbi:MAG: hypothetical protein JWR69_3226 [Pedosphaera sp.]|nr:hypothetical protein [Pedosphaera sp.]
MGEALGSNEEAARKRVTRALTKLHPLLTQRGVALSTAALGAALASEAVTAAPAGLAVSISGSALTAAAIGTGPTLTLLNFMVMTKLKLGVMGAILIVSVMTPLVIQHRAQARWRAQDEALRQQIAELQAENGRLSL